VAVLAVDGVEVRFGGLVALDDVSLEVPAGRVTGLIGPNGAGKTTLFDVITGLQRATTGSVLLDGQPIGHLAPFRRARLGLTRTFQRLELFGTLTVRENLVVAAAGATRTAPSVDEVLDRLGLRDVAERRADELPTGLGRLVELGRCLAVAPTVLLLDEPASGQTESETETFAAVLEELAADGLAVLLVEHDIDLVTRVCAHVVVLDTGSVLAQGTPGEISADPRVRDAYLGAAVPT
jgi:branched-chain amino acid transport system ATP-binding protein